MTKEIQFLKELSALLKKYDTYIWAGGEAELDSCTPIKTFIGVHNLDEAIVELNDEDYFPRGLDSESIDSYIKTLENKQGDNNNA